MKRLRSCYKIYNIIKIHCFNSVLDLTLSRSLGFYSIKIKKISLPLKICKFHLMVRNGRARFRGCKSAASTLTWCQFLVHNNFVSHDSKYQKQGRYQTVIV